MPLELLAIDLGKRSFHLYGIDTDGVILSQKVSRAKLAEVVGNLAAVGFRGNPQRVKYIIEP
jgi:transposase